AARQPEVSALRDIENFGQAGIFVAAQCRINDMVSDDARVIVRVADTLQRRLCQSASFSNAEADATGWHGVSSSPKQAMRCTILERGCCTDKPILRRQLRQLHSDRHERVCSDSAPQRR